MKGTPVPNATAAQSIAEIFNHGLGDANLQPRGLGFGEMVNGGNVGSLNAVWAFVTVGAGGRIDVPHNLGVKPTFCMLAEVRIPDSVGTGVHCLASAVNREQWTGSVCRMDVNFVVGAGPVICVFLVGGP